MTGNWSVMMTGTMGVSRIKWVDLAGENCPRVPGVSDKLSPSLGISGMFSDNLSEDID